MARSFDVIILGAGAMGSAATYYLSKAGQRVLCLEQFELNHCYGSSNCVSRIIRYAYDNPIYVDLMRAAYPLWFALEEEAGETLYIKTGGIDYGSLAQSSLQNISNSLHAANIPYEILTAAQATACFPQFRFDENMDVLYQADTGILAASKCVLTHLRLAQSRGAVIQANTPVTEVVVHDGSVEIKTNTETYWAGNLVITAGGWAKSLLAQLGLDIPLRVMPCQIGFFEADKPEDYEPGKFPVFLTHMSGIYGEAPYSIPSVDGSGVKVSTFYGWETVAHPQQINYTPKDEWVEQLRTFIHSYIPGANGVLLSSRICLYTMTPDKHFVIDRHPEHPHIIFGAGFSGHGFKFSTLVGQIFTDLVLSGSTKYDISVFKVSRFQEKTYKLTV